MNGKIQQVRKFPHILRLNGAFALLVNTYRRSTEYFNTNDTIFPYLRDGLNGSSPKYRKPRDLA
jgi:hypothetical protein